MTWLHNEGIMYGIGEHFTKEKANKMCLFDNCLLSNAENKLLQLIKLRSNALTALLFVVIILNY